MLIGTVRDQVTALKAIAADRHRIIDVTVRLVGELPSTALNYLNGFIDPTDPGPNDRLLRLYEDNLAYTSTHDVTIERIGSITLNDDEITGFDTLKAGAADA